MTHTNMEAPQGNSMCSYLKQAKMPFFLFYKIGEGEGRTVFAWRKGEEVGKGCRRVNMVQILCTHVHKLKNETC
jgi:hypothetical protein